MRVELRRHPRTRILLPVTVRLPGGAAVEAVATDVSLGGLFLLEDPALARATTGLVELQTDAGAWVRGRGRVVRRQRPAPGRRMDVPGLGLSLSELDGESAAALARLCLPPRLAA